MYSNLLIEILAILHGSAVLYVKIKPEIPISVLCLFNGKGWLDMPFKPSPTPPKWWDGLKPHLVPQRHGQFKQQSRRENNLLLGISQVIVNWLAFSRRVYANKWAVISQGSYPISDLTMFQWLLQLFKVDQYMDMLSHTHTHTRTHTVMAVHRLRWWRCSK